MAEDGEIRDERSHAHRYDERDDEEFSMSSYDGDQGDSLDIKPPQAVVARREKREKRDKRERHRHKADRHKGERHRSHRNIVPVVGSIGAPPPHDERRRDHRRHRNMERRDGRRHEKHKNRLGKHDRTQLGEMRKIEKDRKLPSPQREERRRGDRLIRGEYPMEHETRGHYRSYSGGAIGEPRTHDHNASLPSMHYQEKRGDSLLPPLERTERDKRMAKLMVAGEYTGTLVDQYVAVGVHYKQKAQSQKEADVRRQRREEEKKEELRRMDKRPYDAHGRSQKKRKHHHYNQDSDDIQIVSDDDMDQAVEEEDDDEDDDDSPEEDHPIDDSRSTQGWGQQVPSRRSKGDEQLPKSSPNDPQVEEISSGSSDSETDSDSDSTSTASEEEEDEEEVETEIKEEKNGNHAPDHKMRSPSTDVSPDKDDRYGSPRSDLDERSDFDDEIGGSSPESTVELKEQLPAYYPATMGCRSVDEFVCLNRIEEGTYGVVYRAREKATNSIVALKRLKMEKEKEGFPITSLREVNTLLKGQHQNIVTVREIVVGSNMDKIYIVMDYVEHDLKSLMETMKRKKQSFNIGEVKTLLLQLLRAVHHLHDNWILHRDLKTSNLLLSHRGILKVGDFGLAREYGSPLKSYTPIVVTLWYRAPELLLGTKVYSTPIDVWSVGCIFGELLGMEAMFPGKSDIDQLNKIFKDLGTPSDKIWPGYNQLPIVRKTQFADYPYNHLREKYTNRLSDEGFKLLNRFLTYNPSARIKCIEALDHKYFTEELPAPIDPAMFPTWPAKSETPHDRTKKTGNSPKPPSGGKNFKDLGDGEDENIAKTHGFFLGEAVQPGAGFTLKF